jgi:hypothetical protein
MEQMFFEMSTRFVVSFNVSKFLTFKPLRSDLTATGNLCTRPQVSSVIRLIKPVYN